MMKPLMCWQMAIPRVIRRAFRNQLKFFRARRGAELRPEQMVPQLPAAQVRAARSARHNSSLLCRFRRRKNLCRYHPRVILARYRLFRAGRGRR